MLKPKSVIFITHFTSSKINSPLDLKKQTKLNIFFSLNFNSHAFQLMLLRLKKFFFSEVNELKCGSRKVIF